MVLHDYQWDAQSPQHGVDLPPPPRMEAVITDSLWQTEASHPACNTKVLNAC